MREAGGGRELRSRAVEQSRRTGRGATSVNEATENLPLAADSSRLDVGSGVGDSPRPQGSSRLPPPASRLRIGVDIGGTFTDLVVYDDESGAFVVGKTLTTAEDPSRGIETGLTEILA